MKNDQFFLADFGLVDDPDKADITSTGEQIGAKRTIAPEMKWSSQRADGKPADVYSLAKTLWILLTGRRDSFEGQYDYNRSGYGYDGRHWQMDSDKFREYIDEKVCLARQICQDSKLEMLAKKRGFEMREFVFSYLDKTFRQEYLERFSRDVRQ